MTTPRRMLLYAARSGAPCLVLLACLLVSASVARAQMSAYPVHDPFTEGNRFTVRNLSLNGQGNRIVVPAGGVVQAEMDIRHHCRSCGGAINQIIVGLGGDAAAQACVWSGGQSSRGWRRVQFSLHVPDEPGTYQVRVRYAQAYTCQDALGWWRVDCPDGPTLASNIGLVTVAPPPASLPGTGDRVTAILAKLDRRLARVEQLGARLESLSRARPNRRTLARIRKLSRKMSAHTRRLRRLQSELAGALAHQPRMPEIPVIIDPPVSTLPVPRDFLAMPRHEFDALVQRLRAESFESSRMNLLRDALQANARFDISQALRIMALFGFGRSQVEAATLLCEGMVEQGALPRMIAALSFESARDDLRKRTGGRCGPAAPYGR